MNDCKLVKHVPNIGREGSSICIVKDKSEEYWVMDEHNQVILGPLELGELPSNDQKDHDFYQSMFQDDDKEFSEDHWFFYLVLLAKKIVESRSISL